MGDIKRTVSVLFNGVDNVSKVINQIEGNTEKWADNIGDVGEPFQNITEQVLILNAAIAALAVAGIKASSDIETESKKMAGSLGLPTEEAEKFSRVAREVYASGFGDNLADVFTVAGIAQKRFTDETVEGIGAITTNALALQEVFDADYTRTMGAVSALMDNFGLTAQQAFDFIAQGYQVGLDGSGDFLESITEYSTQFSNGGADAAQFFSVMQTGFGEGILGTDKAADAFKEFRVRIQDGSKTTAEALALLGLDDSFVQSLNRGETSAIQAFDTIIQKLNETDDSSIVMQAGVGLLGTQFEDLGTKTALAMNTANTSVGDLAGSMGTVVEATDTFENRMKSALRTVVDSFGDLTIWDKAKDKISVVFGDITALLPEAFENADLSKIEDVADRLFNIVAGVFKDNDLDLTTLEGIENAINTIIDTIASVGTVTAGIIEPFTPLFTIAKQLLDAFNALDSETKELVGNILGLGTGLVAVSAAFSGLSSAVGIVGSLVALFTGPVGLAVGIGVAASALLVKLVPAFESTAKSAEESAAYVKALDTNIASLPDDKQVEVKAALDAGNLDEAVRIIQSIPEELIIDLDTKLAKQEADALEKELVGLHDELMNLDVVVLEADASQAKKEITDLVQVGTRASGEPIYMKVETQGVGQAKAEIEQIPTDRQVEIKLQGDIDKEIEAIKQTGETVRASFEWEAKLNIANVEAGTKRMQAAFESVDNSVSSTGDTLASLAATFASFQGSTSARWELQDLLRDESKRREEAFNLQQEMGKAQLAMMKAQQERWNNGGALIEIDASGVGPALDLVLREILEKAQIWASEQAQESLFSLGL